MHRTLSDPARRDFRRREDGGVSVEWVLLTAAMTGICVAALGAEKDALRAFWFDIAGEVTGADANDPNLVTTSHDFEDGASRGWSGAAVSDIAGFGKALGPIRGGAGPGMVTRDFAIPAGADRAVIVFDLYALDGLGEDDDAILYVGGVPVGRIGALTGDLRDTGRTVPGVSVTSRLVADGADLGGFGTRGAHDAIIEVAIAVDDPGPNVSFGFRSAAGAGSQGSYALDRFSVRSSAGP